MDDGWVRRALATKRDGGELDAATWRRFVEAYVAGTIDDAPLAALAMACTIRGMTTAEIAALTAAMVESGDAITFPPDRIVVDKHSSGGVADSVSLVVVPLVAACGVPVAKLSGRALGHTGGTLDKLEAIPGLRTALAPEAFVAQVLRVGCAIAAQSERLDPADKKLYTLRDRTSTIPAPGLIASSIVSKKIAGGAHAIVYDVKAGRGAFVRDVAHAASLADLMVRATASFGRRASAIVSDMDEPLGSAIGSGIEALEARDFLRGDERAPRLAEAALAIAREMLRVGGVPEGEAAARAVDALDSGAAYERFTAMIAAQGGDVRALEGLAAHPRRASATAGREGRVTAIDAVALGELARELVTRDGPFAGIRVVAPVGTAVRRGEVLAEVCGDAVPATAVARAFTVADAVPAARPLIAAVVRDAPPESAAKARA